MKLPIKSARILVCTGGSLRQNKLVFTGMQLLRRIISSDPSNAVLNWHLFRTGILLFHAGRDEGETLTRLD